MGVIHAIIGCLLGGLVYSICANYTPCGQWGTYSTCILVALCLVMTAWVGIWPWGTIVVTKTA
jgi:hypothetical protein